MTNNLKQFSIKKFNIDELHTMKKQKLFIPKVKIENYGEVYFTRDMNMKDLLSSLSDKFNKYYHDLRFKYSSIDEIPCDVVRKIQKRHKRNILEYANDYYPPNVAIITTHLKMSEENMEHVSDSIFKELWTVCNSDLLFSPIFNYINKKYKKCIKAASNDLIGIADEKLIGEITLSHEFVQWNDKTIFAFPDQRYVESDVKL